MMSTIAHYFENLLFYGKDVKGDDNADALTSKEREAVEECAVYVLCNLFDGRADFEEYLDGKRAT